jgi:hypothetical protein
MITRNRSLGAFVSLPCPPGTTFSTTSSPGSSLIPTASTTGGWCLSPAPSCPACQISNPTPSPTFSADATYTYGPCVPNTGITQMASEIQTYMSANNLTWPEFQTSTAGVSILQEALTAGDLTCLETDLGVPITTTSSSSTSDTSPVASFTPADWGLVLAGVLFAAWVVLR